MDVLHEGLDARKAALDLLGELRRGGELRGAQPVVAHHALLVGVANGDIVDGETALRCLARTGADGLMIGRASFGDPWVFTEIRAALAGEPIPARPPLAERVDTAVRQFELARTDKGERIACLEARKHFAWYLRGVAHSGYYKAQISDISSMEDIYRIAKGIQRDLS